MARMAATKGASDPGAHLEEGKVSTMIWLPPPQRVHLRPGNCCMIRSVVVVFGRRRVDWSKRRSAIDSYWHAVPAVGSLNKMTVWRIQNSCRPGDDLVIFKFRVEREKANTKVSGIGRWVPDEF